MRIGLVNATAENPNAGLQDVVDELKKIDAEKFPFVSLPNIFGVDAITAIALAGRETQKLEMATGVVPTPPRHPTALAQQALTTQEACGGRFTLGIGLSHKIVIENMFGLSYSKPAAQMREYLEVLIPLLEGKPAAFAGDHYNVAGQLTQGTTTWMTGLKTLGDHVVPTITAAADAAGRPQPRVLAAIPVALTEDVEAAREACNKAFAIYPTLPSYKAMLDREGVASASEIALLGDESTILKGIAQFRDAGVTDFAASIFPAGPGTSERTRELLLSAQ
jgi:5,10-methylenetetrahydromethanopterin reductase